MDQQRLQPLLDFTRHLLNSSRCLHLALHLLPLHLLHLPQRV
jgi:hypothetical protein